MHLDDLAPFHLAVFEREITARLTLSLPIGRDSVAALKVKTSTKEKSYIKLFSYFDSYVSEDATISPRKGCRVNCLYTGPLIQWQLQRPFRFIITPC